MVRPMSLVKLFQKNYDYKLLSSSGGGTKPTIFISTHWSIVTVKMKKSNKNFSFQTF